MIIDPYRHASGGGFVAPSLIASDTTGGSVAFGTTFTDLTIHAVDNAPSAGKIYRIMWEVSASKSTTGRCDFRLMRSIDGGAGTAIAFTYANLDNGDSFVDVALEYVDNNPGGSTSVEYWVEAKCNLGTASTDVLGNTGIDLYDITDAFVVSYQAIPSQADGTITQTYVAVTGMTHSFTPEPTWTYRLSAGGLNRSTGGNTRKAVRVDGVVSAEATLNHTVHNAQASGYVPAGVVAAGVSLGGSPVTVDHAVKRDTSGTMGYDSGTQYLNIERAS